MYCFYSMVIAIITILYGSMSVMIVDIKSTPGSLRVDPLQSLIASNVLLI